MIEKGTRGPGLFCATVGLSAVVTAGFGWLEVLAGWGIAGVLKGILPKERGKRCRNVSYWLLIGAVILSVAVLVEAEQAFPQDNTFPFVSAGLLFLFYRTLIGEKETGRMVSNVLGLVLLVLFGAMFLFGFSDGHWGGLKVGSIRWKQIWITVLMACPWWGEKKSWGWYAASAGFSVATSVLCRVLLGAALTEFSPVPMFRAAQTIEVMGVPQHLEGFVATAVLLGAYSMLCYIGSLIREWGETQFQEDKRRLWWGIVLSVVFFLEWAYRLMGSLEKERIATVFWGFTGIVALLVVILRKMKKVLDKWRIVG